MGCKEKGERNTKTPCSDRYIYTCVSFLNDLSLLESFSLASVTLVCLSVALITNYFISHSFFRRYVLPCLLFLQLFYFPSARDFSNRRNQLVSQLSVCLFSVSFIRLSQFLLPSSSVFCFSHSLFLLVSFVPMGSVPPTRFSFPFCLLPLTRIVPNPLVQLCPKVLI